MEREDAEEDAEEDVVLGSRDVAVLSEAPAEASRSLAAAASRSLAAAASEGLPATCVAEGGGFAAEAEAASAEAASAAWSARRLPGSGSQLRAAVTSAAEKQTTPLTYVG